MRFKRTKDFKIWLFIITIFSISIGYALITVSLNINGRGSVAKVTWDVHLENLQVDPGSVTARTPASITSDGQDVNFSVKLTQPGDYYKFTVDVVNAGTVDAVIESINKTSLTEEQSKYLNYVVRCYGSNTSIASDYVIPADYKQKIVVMIEYKSDVVSTLDNIDLSLSMRFVQKSASKKYSNVAYNFFMIKNEAVFTVPKTGTYRLEAWGAQGGNGYDCYGIGGYGGYSTGVVSLTKGTELFIVVGEKGVTGTQLNNVAVGGYNGGGQAYGWPTVSNGSGGGATHIATKSGLLSSLENYKSNILIVSAGGGGGATDYLMSNSGFHKGGNAGGFIGNNGDVAINSDGSRGFGATQQSGGSYSINEERKPYPSVGSFGKGGNASTIRGAGAGSGYYGGGGASVWNGAGGGSSYIGNSLLTNKAMYCYNCQESAEESTKTISTTNVSAEPLSQYAKIGDGYARITYIG